MSLDLRTDGAKRGEFRAEVAVESCANAGWKAAGFALDPDRHLSSFKVYTGQHVHMCNGMVRGREQREALRVLTCFDSEAATAALGSLDGSLGLGIRHLQ